ncbi:MAG: hypothetical protein AAGL17_03795 [Cyanobacteria bacterium J06576_12]
MENIQMLVETAVNHFKSLDEATEATQSIVDASEVTITETTEKIDQYWNDLVTRSQALLSQMEEGRNLISSTRAEVDEEMENLKSNLELAKNQIDEGLAMTQSSITELSGRAEELTGELETSFNTTSSSFDTLKSHAEELSTHLGDVMENTQGYLLEELDSDLDEHDAEIQQQLSDLESCILGTCLPNMSEKAEDFTAHAGQLIEELAAKLESVGNDAEESTMSSFDMFETAYSDQLSGVMDMAADVKTHLVDTSTFVIELVGDVQETTETLLDAVSTTNIGVEAAVGTLEDVIDLLTLDF